MNNKITYIRKFIHIRTSESHIHKISQTQRLPERVTHYKPRPERIHTRSFDAEITPHLSINKGRNTARTPGRSRAQETY